MVDVVARAGAGIILMHMHGTPRTMQQAPRYDDVVEEISVFFEERIRFAMQQAMALYEDRSFLIQVLDLVSCWYITLRC